MKSAVIIGGGPAGCQCALWLHMLGYEVVLVEKSSQLGGLQFSSPYINNWIVGTMGLAGQDIAKNIQNHIEVMNIPFYLNESVKKINEQQLGFEIEVGGDVIRTHNIVITTGVKPRSSSLMSADNVIIGPGKEIDNFNFTNKKVAILGGGDNAAENYAFIKNTNPKECHLYAKKIIARNNLFNKIDPNDVFLGKYSVDQNTMVINYNNQSLQYDVIVVLYGWESNIPEVFEKYRTDLVDDDNFIITDSSGRTRIPNIFAGGEVSRCQNPCVVTAMADGVVIAKTIQMTLG